MKKTIDNITKYLYDNRIYIITIVIMITVMIMGQILSCSIPFGNNNIVAGDGLYQEYPVFSHKMREIKNLNFFSFFSFDIGGFYDIYRMDTVYYIFHPWVILQMYFLPNKYALYIFSFDFIINYLFSSVSIIFYLTHKFKNPLKKDNVYLIYLALAYGLCNYSLAFFHYKTFMYMQYLPLIVLGLEHALYKKKPALYISMMVLSMIFDPYHSFLLCEFLILIFLIQDFESIKDFIIKGIHFAIYSIIPACLSCIELMPFLKTIVSESAYQNLDNSTPSLFTFFDSYTKLITDYYLGNIYKGVSEYNYKAGIYCGIFILCLLPFYIASKKIKLSIKIRTILAATLLFISFNNELLNYVFHGFHYQTMVPNRHAGFYIFIIVCISADIIYYHATVEKQNKLVLLFMTIISIIFINIYTFTQDVNTTSYKIAVFFPIIYIATSAILILTKKSHLTLKVFIFIASIEICLNAMINLGKSLGGNNAITSINDVIENITDDIPDMTLFYNTTQYLGDNPSYDNMGLVTDISSLSFFTSGLTSDNLRRISYYNLFYSTNNMQYRCGNPLADIMLHIKYHIENINDNTSFSIYDTIYQYNEYVIHENNNSLKLGTVINNTIDNYPNMEINELSFDYHNRISNFIGGKDIYTSIHSTKYSKDKKLSSNDNYYTIGEKYENREFNGTTLEYIPVTIHFDESLKGYIYASVNGNIYLIGELDENNHELTVDYPEENVNEDDFVPDVALFNTQNYNELVSILKETELYDLKQNGRSIEGKYENNFNGTLYISIPYNENWDIYIDGQKTEFTRYLGGIGVNTTSGNHSLLMKYNPPGMYSGIIISLTTLLLLIIYSIIKGLKKKN